MSWVVSTILALLLTVAMLFLNWVVIPGLQSLLFGESGNINFLMLADFLICFSAAAVLMYIAQSRRHPHGVFMAAVMAFIGWWIYFWEVGFLNGMIHSQYALWYELLSFVKYPGAFALSFWVATKRPNQRFKPTDPPPLAVGSEPNAPRPLWNPNAAANWSLLFTPAFGSFLNMLNWRTLGESDRAASSKKWFIGSIGMLGIYLLIAMLVRDGRVADGAARGLGLTYLFVWYFVSGKSQAKFVKAKFGSNYPRQPWGKALLCGIGGSVAYFIAAIVLGVMVGIMRGFLEAV